MPSISHRTSLGQGAPHRAKSGLAALPAGFVRGCMRGIVGWLVQSRDDWRAPRRIGVLDDHLRRDIGLADTHDLVIAPPIVTARTRKDT